MKWHRGRMQWQDMLSYNTDNGKSAGKPVIKKKVQVNPINSNNPKNIIHRTVQVLVSQSRLISK